MFHSCSINCGIYYADHFFMVRSYVYRSKSERGNQNAFQVLDNFKLSVKYVLQIWIGQFYA